MDRRDFLKMSSMAVLSAAGAWTGVSKIFAQSDSYRKNEFNKTKKQSDNNMEFRNLT